MHKRSKLKSSIMLKTSTASFQLQYASLGKNCSHLSRRHKRYLEGGHLFISPPFLLHLYKETSKSVKFNTPTPPSRQRGLYIQLHWGEKKIYLHIWDCFPAPARRTVRVWGCVFGAEVGEVWLLDCINGIMCRSFHDEKLSHLICCVSCLADWRW